MAGHSKWANIQHRKNAQDAKRGKLFTKLIRAITVAARGSPIPETNPRLRLAIDKALSACVTKEAIERAIKRSFVAHDTDSLEEIRYEGYGPHGIAVLIEALTDNRNRTVAEIRHAFSKAGGSLGSTGSVAYLFMQKGCITLAPGADEPLVFDQAVVAGADDVLAHDDGSMDVLTEPSLLAEVRTVLSQLNLTIADAELTWIAQTKISLTVEERNSIERLIDVLEDLDDVQAVYVNMNDDE